jgi:hypothetical protein
LREITKLQEQIRERDHDRSERERLTKEVSLSLVRYNFGGFH